RSHIGDPNPRAIASREGNTVAVRGWNAVFTLCNCQHRPATADRYDPDPRARFRSASGSGDQNPRSIAEPGDAIDVHPWRGRQGAGETVARPAQLNRLA